MKRLFRKIFIFSLLLHQWMWADDDYPHGYESLACMGFDAGVYYGYLTQGAPSPVLLDRAKPAFDRNKLLVINPGMESNPLYAPPPAPKLSPFSVGAGVLDPQNPQNQLAAALNYCALDTGSQPQLSCAAQSALVFLQQPLPRGAPGGVVVPFDLPLSGADNSNPPPVRSGARYTLSP